MPTYLTCASLLRRVLLCLGSCLLCLGSATSGAGNATSALAEAIAANRLQAWEQLFEKTPNESDAQLLERINSFVNGSVLFGEDSDIWGQNDYWASPQETLARGRGDCEDIAIAKYFALLRLGMNDDKLRLTFVKDLNSRRAHMVLAYYAGEGAEPLILDNLRPQILPASQRPDLLPVYAFNNQGIFVDRGLQKKSSQSPQLLSRWQDVSARALAEGALRAEAPRG